MHRPLHLVTLSPCHLVILLLALLPSCTKPPAADGKPVAVATIFTYYDALRSIAGDDTHAELLLTPGTSPHEYSPTPRDKIVVSSARLLIRNGLNIDDWAKALASDNTDLTQLAIGESIQTIENKEETLPGQKPEENESRGRNPHVWLDPQNQIKAAEMIRDALVKIDPSHETGYTQRTAAYIADIQKLDADFQDAAKTFTHKEFIGFHSAYGYLARRYGLKQVASLQEVGSEGMSPVQIQKVIAIIKERHVPVVFSETAFDSRQVQIVVNETGVKLETLQPLETYDKIGDTYVSLMRQNLEQLKKTMQ